MVIVDRPHHIAWNRVLQNWRERNQQVDRNFFPLEQTSHFDHVVGALRVTDQDQRTALAGGMIFDDVRNGRPPGQMSDGLGFDALAPELFGKAVEAGREYAKPAAQKIDPSLGLGGATP